MASSTPKDSSSTSPVATSNDEVTVTSTPKKTDAPRTGSRARKAVSPDAQAVKAGDSATVTTDLTNDAADDKPAKKPATRKAAAKKTTAKKAPAKKAAAKKATAKKASAKKATAKKTAAKKTTTKKAAAKKATAKKATAKKTVAKKAAVKKTAAVKKSAAKKAPVRKTAAKKTTAKKQAARTPVPQTLDIEMPEVTSPVAPVATTSTTPTAAKTITTASEATAPKSPEMVSLPVLDGMGAIVHTSGVGFRVWAPNAQSVRVVGDFNDWSTDIDILDREDDGCWYAFVEGAKAGQEYKFSIVTSSGDELSRVDPYAAQVTTAVGNGVIYSHDSFDWEGDAQQVVEPKDLVVYAMHIGSFYDVDADGPGTFKLATQRLEHLKALGVNALQLMPVAEYDGKESWGFTPSNIFAVESAYGGPDGFKSFVKTAHAMGFAVILDVVYNHFGAAEGDLWQFDGWNEHGKGGIYVYNDHRAASPWGETRPDYGRAEVRSYLSDNAVMWLRDYHLDGLRVANTQAMHSTGMEIVPEGWDVLREITSSVREEFPGRVVIAHDGQGNEAITQVEGHGAGFHAQWDDAFADVVRGVLSGVSDADRDMFAVRHIVESSFNGESTQRVTFVENFDELSGSLVRMSATDGIDDPTGWHARKRAILGAGLMLTSAGIPMLLQGQEFMAAEQLMEDGAIDWHQRGEFRGMVRCFRDLIALREEQAGLTGGFTKVFRVDNDDKVLAFQRRSSEASTDDVVVVVNFSTFPRDGYRIGLPSDGEWSLEFNSDSTFYSDDFGNHDSRPVVAEPTEWDGLPCSAEVNIAPYSMLVFTKK